MDALTAFKNDLTRYLRGRLATAGDVQVAGEYPPGLQKRPQRGCCVAVGLDGASRPGDAGGRVRLTMRFDIICPVGQQPGCHAVYEELCGLLFCRENAFGAAQIECGELTYDQELDCLSLTARAVLNGILNEEPDTDGLPFKEILVYAERMERDD